MSALKVTSSSPLEEVDSFASDPACTGMISPGVNMADPVSPKSFAALLFGVAGFLVARFLGVASAGVKWYYLWCPYFFYEVLMAFC